MLNNFKTFTAKFPVDGSPLEYYVDYTHLGGSNKADSSGHTARDSHLVFKDASGKNFYIDLVDNSGAAHHAKNLQFNKECLMKPMPLNRCSVTLYYHNLAGGDDRAIKNIKSFDATFPSDGSALQYYIEYSDFGGSN